MHTTVLRHYAFQVVYSLYTSCFASFCQWRCYQVSERFVFAFSLFSGRHWAELIVHLLGCVLLGSTRRAAQGGTLQIGDMVQPTPAPTPTVSLSTTLDGSVTGDEDEKDPSKSKFAHSTVMSKLFAHALIHPLEFKTPGQSYYLQFPEFKEQTML